MTTSDPLIADLRRELAKATDVLALAERHLARHAEANAALHCSERVMYSPLHARVASVLLSAERVLLLTKEASDV